MKPLFAATTSSLYPLVGKNLFYRLILIGSVGLIGLSCEISRWQSARPTWPMSAQSNVVTPVFRGEKAAGYLKEHSAYASLREAMIAARYELNRQEQWSAPGGAYQADNPAQKLKASFTPNEMRLTPEGGEGNNWHCGMRLRGFGYGARLHPLAQGELQVSGNRIEYRRRLVDGSDPGLREWYLNRPEGIEQGFTIMAPPGKKRAGQRLRLALELLGDLRGRLEGEGQAIEMSARDGERALRYSGLSVTDACGRELDAHLALAGRQVSLEVEEDGAVYPVNIDPIFTQQAKLTSSDGAQADSFGDSVAISGETAVVGASRADVGGNHDQGAAYVFVRSGTSWSQQQKLVASDGAANDSFGHAVAISGDTIVVGAPAANSFQGAAYVFVRSGTSWSQQQKLIATDGASSNELEFGNSVAISAETVVIGAPGAHIGSNFFQGAAYVFVRSGTNWSQQQKLTASDGAASDRLGLDVAISGETAVAGAPGGGFGGSSPGKAYVFVRSGTSWSQQQKLTASDGAASDSFGGSVAISGDTVVTGALFAQIGGNPLQGAAYVFVRSGTNWSQQQKLTASDGAANDDFGISVAITGDTVVVGAPAAGIGGGNSNPGQAYVFARSGTSWSQQPKLIANDGALGDQLGHSVTISGDTIVSGALNPTIGTHPFQGAAYVFVPASADLAITKSDSPDPVITGSNVTYTITITNNGPTDASSITVTDNLPNTTSFDMCSVSGGVGGSCSGSGNNRTITFTSIPVNTAATITLTARVNCSVADGVAINNTASVTSTTPDPNPGNNTAVTTTTASNPPPVITCPANVNVGNDPGQCSASFNPGMATATDNCPGVVVTGVRSDGQALTAPYPVGVRTITWSATDSGGRAASCVQTITVRDIEPPKVTCPANVVAVTNKPEDGSVVVTYPAPVVTDNCPGATVVCAPPSGSIFPLGTTTVNCTATDASNNTASCSFKVTVFNVCLQDDKSGDFLVFNSFTGEYQFTRCGVSGFTLSGIGRVSKTGCRTMLREAKVSATLDRCIIAPLNRGKATIKPNPIGGWFYINDSNTANNTCKCP